MQVRIIAQTKIDPDAMHEITKGKWSPEEQDDDASALAEFSGRQCYESWNRPNPETATNRGYLANVIEHEHFSVLEHGSVSMHIEGVSRSLTHELVRHRHTSPSQLSQRYVKLYQGDKFVVPPLYHEDWDFAVDEDTLSVSVTQEILETLWSQAVREYDRLVAMWQPRLMQSGVDPHRARKMAREAARCVLPNMTPTALVLTGNHRAWRDLLIKRGSIHADAEIRALAVEVFRLLAAIEPYLYQDFRVVMTDGVLTIDKASDGN